MTIASRFYPDTAAVVDDQNPTRGRLANLRGACATVADVDVDLVVCENLPIAAGHSTWW